MVTVSSCTEPGAPPIHFPFSMITHCLTSSLRRWITTARESKWRCKSVARGWDDHNGSLACRDYQGKWIHKEHKEQERQVLGVLCGSQYTTFSPVLIHSWPRRCSCPQQKARDWAGAPGSYVTPYIRLNNRPHERYNATPQLPQISQGLPHAHPRRTHEPH